MFAFKNSCSVNVLSSLLENAFSVKRFTRNFSQIRSAICFGGGNMFDQGKDLKRGCEILIATPGTC